MAPHTLCQPSDADHRANAPSVLKITAEAVTRAIETLLVWQQRARQRRELSALDSSFLKDMGIDHGAAYREASKPFWRA